MKYMTKHKMAIRLQKLYAMKTASGGERRKYGVSLSLVGVECTNKDKICNNMTDKFFDDDDNDF